MAIITGRSVGIGLATAERFAGAGWSVAVLARHERRLAEAAGRIERHGKAVLTRSVDIADANAVEPVAGRAAIDVHFTAVSNPSATSTTPAGG